MIDHREKGIEDNAEVEDFFASDLVIFNKLTINDWVKLIKLCDRQFYISKSKILGTGNAETYHDRGGSCYDGGSYHALFLWAFYSLRSFC